MNAQDFEQMCMVLVKQLRWYAPNPETRDMGKSTGNLATHGVAFEPIDQRTFKIYIDENQAPYMPFTNEPWDIRIIKQGTGRKGETRTVIRTWKNPNEGWFDKSALKLAQLAAHISRGELKKHD